MLWLALGLGLTVVTGGFGLWWWRRRQQRNGRLISFVALLREPAAFDPAVLARIAGRVWDADLGDGESEGEDGFVVQTPISSMIQCRGRMTLINTFPVPYTKDVEGAAEGIVDKRIRALFREHHAWFSVDALGVDHTTPDDEVREWYRWLGKLFAELLDDNCALIYLPETQGGYAVNDDTEAALRSQDPLNALQHTATAPLVEVDGDDPRLQAAVDQARAAWPQFVAAFESQAGTRHAVKAPVTRGGNTEFIWLTVTALEGEKIYGDLANDPAHLGTLKCGSPVVVAVADLNDWCYVDAEENLQGGFTIAAVQAAAGQRPRGRKGT